MECCLGKCWGYRKKCSVYKYLECVKTTWYNSDKKIYIFAKINKKTENPVFACVDKVLSFNYTDTYRKLYDNEQKVDIKFIHGCSID